MKKVVAYVTQTCPHCKTAKDFLRANHIPFEERDVNANAGFYGRSVSKLR